jgi:hypothetical protein
MNTEVNSIENVGVPLFDTFAKELGRSLSLPIAIGSRDAARRPALAVEINAKIAAMAIIAIPISPRNVPAPREIGVSDSPKRTGSTIPIVTKITKRYKSEIIPHERNIPRGISRPGFLHSSATLQILVKPPNEIKIRPAVENIELNPCGAKLSKLEGLIKKNPAII